jgi:hypothetical protein
MKPEDQKNITAPPFRTGHELKRLFKKLTPVVFLLWR